MSFSAALAVELGLKTAAEGEIVTTTTVAMERLPAGWTIVNIHLNVVARLPRMSQGDFIDATLRAKTSSVISRALRPNVSMNAKLENPRSDVAPTGAVNGRRNRQARSGPPARQR